MIFELLDLFAAQQPAPASSTVMRDVVLIVGAAITVCGAIVATVRIVVQPAQDKISDALKGVEKSNTEALKAVSDKVDDVCERLEKTEELARKNDTAGAASTTLMQQHMEQDRAAFERVTNAIDKIDAKRDAGEARLLQAIEGLSKRRR